MTEKKGGSSVSGSAGGSSKRRKVIPGPPPDFDDDAFVYDEDSLTEEETKEIEERIQQSKALVASGPAPRFPDIIPDVLRTCSLNIFSGPTHAGKSTLLADVLTKISKGLDIFGHPSRIPSAVGYIALDHCWDLYEANFRKAGMSEITHYARRDDNEVGVARKLRVLIEGRGTYFGMEYLLRKLYPGGVPQDTLLVIDPIHPLTGSDINDHARIGEAMTDIGQFCVHKRITVIGTAHTAKIQSDPKKRYARAIDRAAGSTAIVAYAETAFSLITPHEIGNGTGRVSEWNWTARGIPSKTLQLVRSSVTGLFVSLEEAGKEDVVVGQQDEVSAAMLLQFFPAFQATVTTGEVVEAAQSLDLPKRTVERYLTTLYTEGYIEKMRKGVYRRRERKAQVN